MTRASRCVSTSTKAPMPESRNTGATAALMISAISSFGVSARSMANVTAGGSYTRSSNLLMIFPTMP